MTSITVKYNQPGGGVVKVTGNSFCSVGIPSLLPVNVTPIIPTLFPPQTFCPEEFPVEIDGIIFETPGTHQFTYQNALGCDSLVSYTILSHITIPSFIDSTICQGESVIIGLGIYDETGTYDVVLENANLNGCDSLIKLNLTVTENLSSIAPTTKLDCIPGSILNLFVSNPPSAPIFNWSSGNGGNIISGTNGISATVDQPGTYIVEVQSAQSSNCIKSDTIVVTQKTAPIAPIIDTLYDNQCNLDSLIIQLDSIADVDSLRWIFSGVDTFKTLNIRHLVYHPQVRYDTLKIEAENECVLSPKIDTILTIKPISLPAMNLSTTEICVQQPITIVTDSISPLVTFQWDLDSGTLNIPIAANTFEVMWDMPGTKNLGLQTIQDSCYSFSVSQTVEVFEPFADLDIFCQSSLNQVVFEWSPVATATQYVPTILSGQTGVQNGNEFTVSGLQPNETVDFLIEIDGANPCGARTFAKTCTAADCPPVTINVSPIVPICLTASTSPIPLSATTNSTGTGVYEWSGNGVFNNTFDASQAGVGVHTIQVKYIDGSCEYRTTFTTEVKSSPVADFYTNSPICQTENAIITFAEMPNATPNWQLGGGILINSIDNKVEVNFANAGIYSVSLEMEENGCTSNILTQQITVEKTLDPIQNTCGATSTSVIFDWQDIPKATGYKVNSITGQTGCFNGSSYLVENLNPLEEVTIEIIAESGNSCPKISQNATCKTLDCPVISAPIINCSANIDKVVFNWLPVPDAVNYTVNSITGQQGVLSGTTYTVQNLSPDETVEIEVTSIGTLICSQSKATQSCTTTTCPSSNIQIETVPDFCKGDSPFQLSLDRMIAVTNLVWSGAGANGVFNPSQAGIFTIEASYNIDVCDYTITQEVEVFEIPSAEFQLSKSEICETETLGVNYTGSATLNAFFNWEFNDGNVLSGAQNGPYELNYLTGGNYEISLQVSENGCVSTTETQSIQVDNQLTTPQISCITSTSEITFEWDDVIGADQYDANITSGQTGTQNGNSFTISGLSPNEMVAISVTASGSTICSPTQAQLTCTAKICPPVTINITEIPEPICEGETFSFQLTANTLGGLGNGNLVWSGAGVNSTGQLETNQLPAGIQTVFLNYEENSCQYSETRTFEISENPDLNTDVESAIWYLNPTGKIETQVTKGASPFQYFWSTGETTKEISGGPGQYCLTVTDQNSCEVEDCYTLNEGSYTVRPVHVICGGESKSMNVYPSTGATFNWSPRLRLSCDDCPSPNADPGRTTLYSVTATLPSGRSESTNVLVVVLPRFICNFSPKEVEKDVQSLISGIDLQSITNEDIEAIDEQIIDFYLEKEVKIAPNPSEGKVTVLTPEKVESVHVFDFAGKQVMTVFEKEIDLSKLSKGVYFIKIKLYNRLIVRRVVLI